MCETHLESNFASKTFSGKKFIDIAILRILSVIENFLEEEKKNAISYRK